MNETLANRSTIKTATEHFSRKRLEIGSSGILVNQHYHRFQSFLSRPIPLNTCFLLGIKHLSDTAQVGLQNLRYL